MTLLDLINKLMKEGKAVRRCEFFLRGDDYIDDEDLFCLKPGQDMSTHVDRAYLPPRMIELGDDPDYRWMENMAAYKKLTGAKEIPDYKKFPILLIHVPLDMKPTEFLDRYFGRKWNEVSPLEWSYVGGGGYTPYLDRIGCVVSFLEHGTPRSESRMNFYMVRSVYGTDFAWGGDIAKDKLPEGLSIINSPVPSFD